MNLKLSELKRGQIIYECERGVNIMLRITKSSHRQDGGWRVCARRVSDNSKVTLFLVDGFGGAYGPRIYDEPAYVGKTI